MKILKTLKKELRNNRNLDSIFSRKKWYLADCLYLLTVATKEELYSRGLTEDQVSYIAQKTAERAISSFIGYSKDKKPIYEGLGFDVLGDEVRVITTPNPNTATYWN